uniref:Chondroitin proteoglycan 4 domain-containing protein n=1 Tax=Parascaris univalens TaxID=6257 RepID=A0A915B483_PARUN
MIDVRKKELVLNIMKTIDFASYFLNLDVICKYIQSHLMFYASDIQPFTAIADARECVANCGIDSNPFNLRSMTIICLPEVLKETKKFSQCMEEEGSTVKSICQRQCGDINRLNDEIETKTIEMNSEKTADEMKLATILRKTNEACGRNNYASACHHLAREEAGEFLYSFVSAVNNAVVEDAEERRLLQAIARSSPPQCNFMYTRGVLFNKTADEIMLRQMFAPSENNLDKYKSQTTTTLNNEFEQLQRRILLKELELLDKRTKLLAKESLKLDLEIALIARDESFANAFDFVGALEKISELCLTDEMIHDELNCW